MLNHNWPLILDVKDWTMSVESYKWCTFVSMPRCMQKWIRLVCRIRKGWGPGACTCNIIMPHQGWPASSIVISIFFYITHIFYVFYICHPKRAFSYFCLWRLTVSLVWFDSQMYVRNVCLPELQVYTVHHTPVPTHSYRAEWQLCVQVHSHGVLRGNERPLGCPSIVNWLDRRKTFVWLNRSIINRQENKLVLCNEKNKL